MTSSINDEANVQPFPRPRRRPPSRPITWTVVGLAVIAAGCGGANRPAVVGSGSNHTEASTTSSGGAMAQLLEYAGCMRAHGVTDFPDPTASPGGGAAIQINGGPGSDLDRNNPTLKAANTSCQSLLPGRGRPAPPASPQKVAAEVAWAQCMRSHGLPGFPDPDSQGAFDSSKMEDGTPAFQAASNACLSLQPAGPTAAVAGPG
jgi:hypothetical protein